MRANVWEMDTIDAMHKALEQYDLKPDPQNPKKLYNSVPIDLIAVDPSKLPKHTTDGRMLDVTLGEFLGLAVMGAFYQHNQEKGYKVIGGLDDISKHQREHIISDGAIRAFDEKSRMIFQQVSAQGYHIKNGETIEEEIIRNVKEKEGKRSTYPDKCALLINVYAPSGGFYIQRLIDDCDLKKFDIYFLVTYKLPALETCTVFYLQPDLPADLIRDKGITFELSRN